MRPDKNTYYLNIASAVSERSTCLRRKFGAVVVKNDIIVSTGYNGASRGKVNCCDTGVCERNIRNIPAGERYELCRSVHAEVNAIIAAGAEKTWRSDLYLYCKSADSSNYYCEPCSMCKRILINAGISRVITPEQIFNVSDWMEQD